MKWKITLKMAGSKLSSLRKNEIERRLEINDARPSQPHSRKLKKTMHFVVVITKHSVFLRQQNQWQYMSGDLWLSVYTSSCDTYVQNWSEKKQNKKTSLITIIQQQIKTIKSDQDCTFFRIFMANTLPESIPLFFRTRITWKIGTIFKSLVCI